jgi:hypothetical protein
VKLSSKESNISNLSIFKMHNTIERNNKLFEIIAWANTQRFKKTSEKLSNAYLFM